LIARRHALRAAARLDSVENGPIISTMFLPLRLSGIRAKLLFIFIFISVLPILILTVLIYEFTSVSFSQHVASLIDSNLDQIRKNLESHTDGYRYLLMQMFGDESLASLIKAFESGDETEKAVIQSRLKSRFSSIAFIKDEIQALTFIWPDLEISGYDKGIESLIQSPLTQRTTKHVLYEAGERGKRGTIISTMPMTYATSVPFVKNLFHLPFPFYDLLDRRLLGVLVLSVNERILTEICAGMQNSVTFIFDSSGRIVSFPEKSIIGKGIGGADGAPPTDAQVALFLKHSGLLPSGKTFINRLLVSDLGWTIVSVASREAFFRQADSLALVSFLLMGGLVIASMIVIVVFTRRFSDSVNELVSVMRSAQSGVFVRAEKLVKRNDEFSYLARGFNDMIEEIRALLVKLQQEKDAVYLATQKRKESEIRALEAQLNPHFLYNTLDCINWMAIEKNEYEISTMLSTLGQILRYGISKSTSVVSVAEEVDWIRQYVHIQRVRFDQAFDFDLHVDPAVAAFPVYKLLMQPFLENAIVHGFVNVSSGGLLKVNIAPAEEGTLAILIEDNGCGMSSQTLEDALSNRSPRIGISNVVERVSAYYGDRGKIGIDSAPGRGTRVSLRLPRP
jgi:two-component system sensor histidine kinase YesM